MRQRRLGLGQEATLDLPRERYLGLDALARRGALLKAQVLDLDGSRVREGGEEAEILFAKALPPEAHLEVDESDDPVLDEERRRHARRDALDADGLGGPEAGVRRRVDEEDKVIGLIYLEVRLGRKSFSEEDLQLLTSLANTAAIKIQNLRLQEGAASRQRIEREMALAWDIQRRLLPEAEPTLPHTELLGRTVPSRTVSGDYYDFFERGDNSLDVVVADVSGKGMGASILAASVQAAFQVWAGEHFPPDRLCTRLNEMVFRRTSPEKFITFFLALYDPESGSVVYTNAGHNPGILVRKDGATELLGAHGPPLGMFAGKTYGSGSFTMGAGDLLALYTDGVTEAANPEDEEFGTPRLVETLVKARALSVAEIEAELGAALLAFTLGTPFGDDRTLVLLKRS